MDIQKINNFLRPLYGNGNGDGYGYGYGNGNGNGNGYGNGDGYGDGDGYGYGYGYGNGNGDGYGYGNGDGYGDGDGYGILSISKQKIYLIDGVHTILTTINTDAAKGFILNSDLTLEKCYIVRNNYHFSHGTTLEEALKSLEEKTLISLPIEKRIELFKKEFKDFNTKVEASVLYDWHFKLTGSCKMGRNSFIQNKHINLTKDKFTVYEFIELTVDQYNGEIIKQLIK